MRFEIKEAEALFIIDCIEAFLKGRPNRSDLINADNILSKIDKYSNISSGFIHAIKKKYLGAIYE